jgi:hypothetical protein
MSNREISLWKVEEFLIDNLTEFHNDADEPYLITYCSMKELFEKLEETINK